MVATLRASSARLREVIEARDAQLAAAGAALEAAGARIVALSERVAEMARRLGKDSSTSANYSKADDLGTKVINDDPTTSGEVSFDKLKHAFYTLTYSVT